MKKILSSVLLQMLIILIALEVNAAIVRLTFEWDPNSETDLAGYGLYQSEVSGSGYSKVKEVGKVTTTTLDIDIIPGESFYFVLDAFDLDGNRSGYSNEVTFFFIGYRPRGGSKSSKPPYEIMGGCFLKLIEIEILD